MPRPSFFAHKKSSFHPPPSVARLQFACLKKERKKISNCGDYKHTAACFPNLFLITLPPFLSLPCYQSLLFQSWEQAASPWEEGGREFPAPPGTFQKHLRDLQDSAQPEISQSPRSQEFPLWKFLYSRQDLGVFHCWDLLVALLTSVLGNRKFPKGILGCKTSSCSGVGDVTAIKPQLKSANSTGAGIYLRFIRQEKRRS